MKRLQKMDNIEEIYVLDISQNNQAVDSLLESWDLVALIPDFLSKGIDIEVLLNLTVEDINRLIPDTQFGTRIKFRIHLFKWRQNKGFCTPLAATESINSSVSNYLRTLDTDLQPNSPSSASSGNISLNLENLLRSSPTGQSILRSYEKLKILSKTDRNELVNIICDFWVQRSIKVTTSTYTNEAKEIVQLFPTESEKSYIGVHWKDFGTKIQTIYKREIKDARSKSTLKLLETDNITENSKNCILLALLPALLKPQIIKTKTFQWKPSTADAQNALALNITDTSFMQSTINKKKEYYIAKSWTLQPFIVTIGSSLEAIDEIYIYFNGFFYKAESILKAVSCLFQLHQVFQVHYAAECKQVWLFIEDYFYDIPKSSVPSNDLVALLTELNL